MTIHQIWVKMLLDKYVCFFPPSCDKRFTALKSIRNSSPFCHTAMKINTHQRQGLARTLLGRLCLFLRCVHVGFYVAIGLEGGGRVEGEILGLGQNTVSGGNKSKLVRVQSRKDPFIMNTRQDTSFNII